jgi:hypothetical protein
MLLTEQFSPSLMEDYYLVQAGIRHFAWFETYPEALNFLLNGFIDRRFAKEIACPTK